MDQRTAEKELGLKSPYTRDEVDAAFRTKSTRERTEARLNRKKRDCLGQTLIRLGEARKACMASCTGSQSAPRRTKPAPKAKPRQTAGRSSGTASKHPPFGSTARPAAAPRHPPFQRPIPNFPQQPTPPWHRPPRWKRFLHNFACATGSILSGSASWFLQRWVAIPSAGRYFVFAVLLIGFSLGITGLWYVLSGRLDYFTRKDPHNTSAHASMQSESAKQLETGNSPGLGRTSKAKTAAPNGNQTQSFVYLKVLSYPWAEVKLTHLESGQVFRFTAPMRSAEKITAGSYRLELKRDNSVKLTKIFTFEERDRYEIRIRLDTGKTQLVLAQ